MQVVAALAESAVSRGIAVETGMPTGAIDADVDTAGTTAFGSLATIFRQADVATEDTAYEIGIYATTAGNAEAVKTEGIGTRDYLHTGREITL